MTELTLPEISVAESVVDTPVLSSISEVVRPFSKAAPTLLRLGLTNEDASELTIECGVPEPFTDIQNRTGDEHYMCLIPEDEEGILRDREGSPVVPSEPDDGCWRVRPT